VCAFLCTGISEPLPVAETFTFEAEDGRQLTHLAKLDTLVTVVDGFNFFRDYTNGATLQDKRMGAFSGDERAVVDLLVDQIEFANGGFEPAGR
jgi:G3E family GTPase